MEGLLADRFAQFFTLDNTGAFANSEAVSLSEMDHYYRLMKEPRVTPAFYEPQKDTVVSHILLPWLWELRSTKYGGHSEWVGKSYVETYPAISFHPSLTRTNQE